MGAGKMTRRTVPAKRAPLSRTAQVAKQTPPVPQANGASPFEIMAGRIANRVAEMAENVTFVERQQQVKHHPNPKSTAPRNRHENWKSDSPTQEQTASNSQHPSSTTRSRRCWRCRIAC